MPSDDTVQRLQKLEEEVSLLQKQWQEFQNTGRFDRPAPAVAPGTKSAVAMVPGATFPRMGTAARPVGATAATAASAQASGKWLSVETYLGANVLGRAGVLALLFALGWFIKLAIDNQWINESMRIALGFSGATALAAWALWMVRREAHLLAQSVAGGAMGAFYLTVSAAYFFYGLFGLTETFLYLALIAGGTTFLSIRARSEILYVFSYVGALAAPLLLSRGENSYQFFFTYLSFVQLAFYFVSRQARLRYSGFLVLVAGYALFGLWARESLPKSSFWIPFLYLLLLSGTLLLQQLDLIRQRRASDRLTATASSGMAQAWSSLHILSNVFLFEFFSHYLVGHFFPNWMEHLSALTAMALFALLLRSDSAGGAALLFALGTTLALGAVVLFLEGPFYIYTLVVLAGMLVLSELRLQPEQKLLQIGGFLLWPAATIALVFFLEAEDNRLLWNSRMAGLLLAVCLALGIYQQARETYLKRTFAYLALFFFLLALFKENHDHVVDAARRNLGYTLILLCSAGALLAAGFLRQISGLRQAGLFLAVLTALKFFAYDILTLSTGVRIVAGITVGLGLILAGLYYQRLQRQALPLLLFCLLPFVPTDLLAEKVRPEGFRFQRSLPIRARNSGDCGRLLIPTDLYRYATLKEIRLQQKDRTIPYVIRSPEERPTTRGAVRQVYSREDRHTTVQVLSLPEPPAGMRLATLVVGHAENESFEASVRLEISQNSEDWTAAGYHSLYVYAGKTGRGLRLPGPARYVRLETSGARQIVARHVTFEPSLPAEYEVPDVEWKVQADSDLAATIIRISNDLPVERLELFFAEPNYSRAVVVHALENREFQELLQSRIHRVSQDAQGHSLQLPRSASGEIKILVYNESDAALTVSKIRMFISEKEMIFPLDLEGQGPVVLYYGNRYVQSPEYDFSVEHCSAFQEIQADAHSENGHFAYSLLEPPVSIWGLRVLFVLLFAMTLFLGYRAFARAAFVGEASDSGSGSGSGSDPASGKGPGSV